MLVLHLDVNKTVVMQDAASQGTGSVQAMINSLMAECVWGRVREGSERATRTVEDWQLASTVPSSECPEPGLVTFNDFVECHSNIPKAVYKSLKQKFTDPGGIGEACREHYNALLASMTVPSADAAGEPEFYFIVPALFHLVRELLSRNVDFALIFRTFGRDIQEVAKEWNTFIEGHHPREPLAPTPRLRLDLPLHTACLQRAGSAGSADETLSLAHVDYQTKCVTLASGFSAVRKAMHAKITQHACLFVQDDYSYWAKHGEADSAGKLLLLPETEAEDETEDEEEQRQGQRQRQRQRQRHIFIDDNIERHRAHIVDVRLDGKSLAFDEAKAFLLRAEPSEIIRDRTWFVARLEERGLL